MSDADDQYVIHEHDSGEGIHFDLMLESAESLRTWRLDRHPQEILSQAVTAISIADHPKRFLTYEGPVQKGKGNVHIVDSGSYAFAEKSDAELKITFKGEILKGAFVLTHVAGDDWCFTGSTAIS